MKFPTKNVAVASMALVMTLGGWAFAQEPSGPPAGPDQGPPPEMMPPPEGPPPRMGPHEGGPWWNNPQLRLKLQLSDEQIQKIDKIARDQHLQEIDLRADVEKQDALLSALMESDAPDKSQALAQVDRLSEAHARLEKSQVETLLATRRVLTAEQAKKLRDLPPRAGGPGPGAEPPEGAPPPPPGGPTQ